MIRLFMQLTKFKLSVAVTVSTVFTFVLARGSDVSVLLSSITAVLLLALGVSALNQYQEWEIDIKMVRTKKRPIPSGRISATAALAISFFMIVTAMFLIYQTLHYTGLALFAFVVLWYNGVYTNLKRYSAFAVVPGGLLGVIPPAIGWLSAGRSLGEPEFLAVALLFFFWQVPHFWLLMAKYEKDYRAAGFPTAIEKFGSEGFHRVLFAWWMLTVLCGLFNIVIFDVQNYVVLSLLIILNLAVIFFGIKILFEQLTPNIAQNLFHKINFFLLGTVILLSIDSI